MVWETQILNVAKLIGLLILTTGKSDNSFFLTSQRVPSVICRFMSNASTVGGGDAKTPTTPSSSPAAGINAITLT